MSNKYQTLKQDILALLDDSGIPNQQHVEKWLDKHLEISKKPSSDEACQESVEIMALYFYCTWYNTLSIEKKIPEPLKHSQSKKELLSAVAFSLPVEANLQLRDLISLMHEVKDEQQSQTFERSEPVCVV